MKLTSRASIAMILAALIAAAASITAASSARAETLGLAEDAATFIRDFGSRATVALGTPGASRKDREHGLRALFSENFNVAALSRFVLGRYYRRASAAERAEFRALYRDYVVAATARNMASYAGETLTVGAARLEGAGLASVASRIQRPEGPPIAIEWRLRRQNDAWQILDVVVEGVSLAITQRAEFSAVIQINGGRVAVLLDKLRELTAGPAAAELRVSGGTG